MNRRKLPHIVGTAAAICLAALLIFSGIRENYPESETEDKNGYQKASITFEPENLTYDGTGNLDLMEGVQARDARGNDLTDQVQAILTAEGTETEKKIRYMVFDEEGRETTRVRTLKMKNYSGPSISAADPLEVSAEDLKDLTAVLEQRGELTADDGFSRSVPEAVSWVRQRTGEGIYQITFTLRNAYRDEAIATVSARISGDVRDITLELSRNQATIPLGGEFYPMDYVQNAADPSYGNLTSRIRVINPVDSTRPGRYTVVYTVTSADGTQKAEAMLNVTVTGGNDDGSSYTYSSRSG